MNHATKLEVLERANRRRGAISDSKGPEYAGSGKEYSNDDSDVLANFKRNGERTATDPLTVWAIYFGKHLDSIETFIREWAEADDAEKRELVKRGEGIISRFDDARNYLDLGECLLMDAGYHPDGWTGPIIDRSGTREGVTFYTKVEDDAVMAFWGDEPS